MTGTLIETGTVRRPYRWLRVGLLACWVVWAVTAYWAYPRPSDFDRAIADLRSGDVVAYQWGIGWNPSGALSWGGPPELNQSHSPGPMFVWRTSAWQVRYALIDPHEGSTFDSWSADTSEGLAAPSRPQTDAIKAAVSDAGGPPYGGIAPPTWYLPTVVGLLALAILLFGPRPVVGTRWFWFWVTVGAPFGLGVLGWLLLEHPWTPRAARIAHPVMSNGGEHRQRGFAGFLIFLLGAIAISLLVYGFQEAIGTWLFPRPLAGHGLFWPAPI